MRKLSVLLALSLCLVGLPAFAGSFAASAARWDTDVGDTFGGSLGLGIELPAQFEVQLRGEYHEELSDDSLDAFFDPDDPLTRPGGLQVAPLESGLRYNMFEDAVVSPWVEGGIGYYVLDIDSPNASVNDETGWYASVGSYFGDWDGFSVFLEGRYRNAEATVERDPEFEEIDDINLEDEVRVDLDGLAVGFGVGWRW